MDRANPSGKVGRSSKRRDDMCVFIYYLEIKDILRTRAEYFVDSA
jgi:hypothetical protein